MVISRAVRIFSFSLEYRRDVSGEYREENHTRGGENDGKNLPDLRDPENIRSDSGDVHQRPVECVPVRFHWRVNIVFHVVENDAAKIDRCEKNRQVRGEQIGDPAACHPAHNERYPVDASCQRD